MENVVCMVLFPTRKSNLISNKEFLFSNIYCGTLKLGMGIYWKKRTKNIQKGSKVLQQWDDDEDFTYSRSGRKLLYKFDSILNIENIGASLLPLSL